ncbi:MAG: hypothetical protein JNN28_19670 [Saprospiraceae bacterium]|nr:hypothetical protein [Saprospiraceae bacterium]
MLDDDFITLTDIIKHNSPEPDDVIKNWMRVKNTLLPLAFPGVPALCIVGI